MSDARPKRHSAHATAGGGVRRLHLRVPRHHGCAHSPGFGRRRLVYNMCTQKPPHNYSPQLYQRYKTSFDMCAAAARRMNTNKRWPLVGCEGGAHWDAA